MADEQLEKITQVQAKYADELMQKPNVVGVAAGLAKEQGAYTQEMALVVLVQAKKPLAELLPEDVLPSELEGVRVDVQEIGQPMAQG